MNGKLIQSSDRSFEARHGQPEPIIILGMCCQENIKAAVVSDLIVLTTSGALAGFVIVENSLLPIGRNVVINRVYENYPDFTHVLLIDADQCGFTPGHVAQMWHADKDIISGVTVTRGKDHKMTFRTYEDQENLTTELVKVIHSGMFFTLIKRKVLDALGEDIEYTDENSAVKKLWFFCDRSPREHWEKEVEEFINCRLNLIEDTIEPTSTFEIVKENIKQAIDFGRDAGKGSRFTGEDVRFCHDAVRAGFEVWINAGIRLGHIGTETFWPGETDEQSGKTGSCVQVD